MLYKDVLEGVDISVASGKMCAIKCKQARNLIINQQ